MIVLKTPSSPTKFAPHCLAGVKLFTGTDLWITWSAMVNATFMRVRRQTSHRRMRLRDTVSVSNSSSRRRQEFLYTLFHGGDVLYYGVIKMESVIDCIVYCSKNDFAACERTHFATSCNVSHYVLLANRSFLFLPGSFLYCILFLLIFLHLPVLCSRIFFEPIIEYVFSIIRARVALAQCETVS